MGDTNTGKWMTFGHNWNMKQSWDALKNKQKTVQEVETECFLNVMKQKSTTALTLLHEVGGLIPPPLLLLVAFVAETKAVSHFFCQTFTCWVVLSFWKMFPRFEWQAVNSQWAHEDETQVPVFISQFRIMYFGDLSLTCQRSMVDYTWMREKIFPVSLLNMGAATHL